ncbi:hypothetical protein STAFG_6828 [Streptomyces afghaniensis 772]|uniref:Uncharacterized protein n=1 Tax=Streptomyces afghaniensis 772 TaxID=1283301 RepID=S4M9Q3_9ACTN|nr:hypothetical protein [Streptomyces sp. HP-A2021]EPJ36148.1 hypothetical protein STAFG_6828 [Streptomyces afghaniensis 772]UOB08596.1 hypothetical protein MQE23_05815 [Streptomyces sp. HP-A2021]
MRQEVSRMARITTPSDGTATERLECWRDAVSRNLAPLDVLPRECSDFHASLHAARFGQVLMSLITAEPHSIARTRRHIGSDAPDFVPGADVSAGHVEDGGA